MSIKETKKDMTKALYIFAAIALINILAFIALGWKKYDIKPKIVFLNVGQGDAALIIGANDKQILIDGGDGKNILTELGNYMPFYDHTLELVIITHPDSDHVAGLIDVLKYYNVKELIKTEYSCETMICGELEYYIRRNNIKTKNAKLGVAVKMEGVDIRILSSGIMEETGKDDDNDNSIIIKANINKKKILLMGDAGYKAENLLLAHNIDLDSDILKVAHHGSSSATSSEFLKKVSPVEAIISVGEKNRYDHPAREVISRLKNMNIDIKRTDMDGDVIR